MPEETESSCLALRAFLRTRIQESGPLPVDEFMAIVLGHPSYGYYTTRDPLGIRGDFTTAPEISQIFGEMLGLWIADVWMKMGRPTPCLLVESGPGRGTLLADALRATRIVPGFHQAVQIHLIETSPVLRATQSRTLTTQRNTKWAQSPTWHEALKTLPDGPMLFLANEFLDALPIAQLVRTQTGWLERFININGQDSFLFDLRPARPDILGHIPPPCRTAPPDTWVEVSPARTEFIAALSTRLRNQGGAALVIDYGHERSAPGETLQAMHAHRFVPVLEHVGEADLTAHVDFAPLLACAQNAGLQTAPITPQGDFLKNLGAQTRLNTLCQSNPDNAESLRSGFERLISPDSMGTLFKVFGLWHGLGNAPEGFS